MAYGICKIKNTSGAELTLRGQVYDAAEIITIVDNDRVTHASDDDVCDLIVSDDIAIHDSDGAITGHAAQVAHLQDY